MVNLKLIKVSYIMKLLFKYNKMRDKPFIKQLVIVKV